MANLTKRIIFIILYWISETQLISADFYCESALCLEENLYCCETNKCCTKPNPVFYAIAWIVAGAIILLMSCGLFFKLRNYFCRMVTTRADEKKPIVEFFVA